MDKQFKEGGRYLVGNNSYYNETLLELKVLEVSEKAIKIKFDNGNSQWYLKDLFPFKFIEELPVIRQTVIKQIIEDRSHEIQFDDDWYEKDEPQFTLKITEENDEEKKLKLEWEKNPSENIMTWYEAMDYAKSLGEGWRLPNINELREAFENKIKGFKSSFYWSSSMVVQDSDAWYVDFSYGNLKSSYKSANYYVRCVRDIL